jgi:hypothetical protein
MLFAAVLRAPIARGRVTTLDLAPALATPGVRGALLMEDVSGIRHDGVQLLDRAVFYAGQAVAAICADSQDAADRALKAVRVAYEGTAHAVTAEDALAPGAPSVRASGNRSRNSPRVFSRGDVDAGLREADVTITREYRTPVALHTALEPHGTVAVWEGNRLTVWESTQGIFGVRADLAEAFELPVSHVERATESWPRITALDAVNEELRTVLRVPVEGEMTPDEHALDWSDIPDRAATVDESELDRRAPAEVSDILFTSGTTGRSKGAMSSHAQSLGVARAWAEIGGLAEGDRYLVVNPFFHSFGYKAGILAALQTGATLIPQASFDVEEALRLIESERVTVLPGAPTIYQMMLDHPRRAARDLSSLRLAVTGAATVPVVLVERMRDELQFDVVLTAYGLTEGVVATMCRPDDTPEVIANTCGRAAAGFAVGFGAVVAVGACVAVGPQPMLERMVAVAATHRPGSTPAGSKCKWIP